MNERNTMLLEIIKEEVRKEVLVEIQDKEKKKPKLLTVYDGNTYTHLDSFCETNIEYFGLNADNFKRGLYKKGLIDFNGTKYSPLEGLESVAILVGGKLYVNRDFIDSMLMLYLIERMDIKNIKDAFEDRLKNNKTEFVKDLYEVSNAEFQRQSPVFKEIRLGVNSVSKIDM